VTSFAQLGELAAARGLTLSPETIQELAAFHAALERANQTTNLTRITGEADFVERHALDALVALPLLGEAAEARLVDVGSGCGVPGIPLAIARPGWRVTLVETANRKARALRQLLDELGELAQRVDVIAERAEVCGQDPDLREAFDLAVARAVGSVPLVCELCLPLVRVGGALVLYRGSEGEAEEALAARVAPKLGGGAVERRTLQLPSGAERSLLRIEKVGPTGRHYPRRPGLPAKRPLS